MTDITEARKQLTRSELLKIRRREDRKLFKARPKLHNLRTKVGARTAFGMRISHAIETLGNCLKATEDDRPSLLSSLAAQLSEIEQHRRGVPLLDTRSRTPHPGLRRLDDPVAMTA